MLSTVAHEVKYQMQLEEMSYGVDVLLVQSEIRKEIGRRSGGDVGRNSLLTAQRLSQSGQLKHRN